MQTPGLLGLAIVFCCCAAQAGAAGESDAAQSPDWSQLATLPGNSQDTDAKVAEERIYSQPVAKSGPARAQLELSLKAIDTGPATSAHKQNSVRLAPTTEALLEILAPNPVELDVPSRAQLRQAAKKGLAQLRQRGLLQQPARFVSSRRDTRPAPVHAANTVIITARTGSPGVQLTPQHRVTETDLSDYVIATTSPFADTVMLPVHSQTAVPAVIQPIGSHDPVNQQGNLIQTQLSADLAPSATAEPATGIEYNQQLVGVFVDNVEKAGLIVAHDGSEYLLPLVTTLEMTGAELAPESSSEDASIRINTPGGPAILKQDDLQLVNGQLMISQSTLATRLLIEVTFDQSSFALRLTLPWSTRAAREYLGAAIPDPDFEPPAASIRNMRADVNYFSSPIDQGSYSDFFMSGNLAGGGWNVRAEQYSNGDSGLFDYFWMRGSDRSQTMIGNAEYSLHPLLPTIEQTGVQYLFSNVALPVRNDIDLSRSNGTRKLANGVRDIAGVAPPGAVAELRVDGRVRARTRVRLDGSYDFPEVELPTRGYAEVQVLILDNRSGALLDTQDFSRRSGIELLADGQHSLFAASGIEGNPLAAQRRLTGTSNAAQWRYGLTENITLEAGRQQMDDSFGNQAALSMAVSKHWFTSLAVAESDRRSSLGLDIEGGSDRWRFDFSGREFKLHNDETAPVYPPEESLVESLEDNTDSAVATGAEKQWARSLNFRYQVNDNLTLGVIGRDVQTAAESTRFLLPNARWTNRQNLSVSFQPNSEGGYRVDSRFMPSRYDSVRYSYEDQAHLIDYRRGSNSGRTLYATFSTSPDIEGYLEFGVETQFDNPGFGNLQLAVVHENEQAGYAMAWEAQLLPGVQSQMRLGKVAREAGLREDANDLSFHWQLTFDFAVAQGRIIAADSDSSASNSAALTGALMLGEERISENYDIDRIELLIDGDNYTAAVQNGRYYIEGLAPGLHRVSIDSRYLPMELSPEPGQSFWVRLEKSAATEVPLALEAKYSFAGRVRNQAGDNLANVRLIVLDANAEPIAELRSDQFGLYRSENLHPGVYQLLAEYNGIVAGMREVHISDAYLFEQDLNIAF